MGRSASATANTFEELDYDPPRNPSSNTKSWISICLTTLVSLLCLTAASIQLLLQYPSTAQDIFGPCRSPPHRREWRTLDHSAQHRFIDAIKCLCTAPSTFKHNGSAYDDLAYVHRWAGQWSHQSASFLPWHRNFVQIFETTLRQTCGFNEPLPYWDWALDWSSPSNSPIWDSDHGFGGDGNITGSFIINEGRCLVDGPFVNMRPLYDNYTANPHCISRGFKNVEINATGTLSGDALRPEGIDDILGKANFKRFHDSVEQTVHDSLHNGINGDFGSLTSANDPLFYVHHVQMDRMWWMWQMKDPATRMNDYAGRGFFYDQTDNAGLDDVLSYLGLAENVTVKEVMRGCDTANCGESSEESAFPSLEGALCDEENQLFLLTSGHRGLVLWHSS